MSRILITLCILLFLFSNTGYGQEISYGFRAGLNFSTFDGPLEEDSNGSVVEDYTSNTGFAVGAAVNMPFTDIFGARGEFMFSQRGGKYSFDGEGYQVFNRQTDTPVYATGTKKIALDISNAYLDFPISGYARVLPWLEISAGVNVGLLVSSTASGTLNFEGVSTGGSVIEPISVTLEYNYYSDEIGEADLGNPIVFNADGQQVEIPRSIGAYYDFTGEDGSLFKFLDFDLQAALAFYLNRGLFVSGRIFYGLTDVTDTDYDVSKVSLNGTDYIHRDDKDTNLTLQVSLGFSF